MTALDGLVLLLIGGGAVRGAFRGFTFEIATLIAWFAGVVALVLFFVPVADWFADGFGSQGFAAVVAFALLFGGTVLVIRLIGRRVGIGIRESIIGPVDRILGFGFGALKGLVAVTLIFLLANLVTGIAFGADRPAWIADARSFPLLNASGRAIVDFVEWRTGDGEAAADRS